MTDFGRRDGDMLKSTYDADENGIVDEAEALVAGADVDANKIKGVTVDDTDKGDTKVLAYNATSQNLEYETQSGGGPADAIRGDGTAGRVFRQALLTIQDGTNANTLKCTTTNLWNHTPISTVDNIAKNATTGGFYLNATGTNLRLTPSILEGNVIAARVQLHRNYSGQVIMSTSSMGAAGLSIYLTNPSTGATIDITALVDVGQIQLRAIYLTDA